MCVVILSLEKQEIMRDFIFFCKTSAFRVIIRKKQKLFHRRLL